MPESLGGMCVGYMVKTLNPSVANKQDTGYYLVALEHMVGKPLARFRLPEEYSELTDVNVANEWASYKNALDRPNHAPEKMQKAVVKGVEYRWNKPDRSRSSSASLLWRTSHEPLSSVACAQPSSILCLGKPGEADMRPVGFQNYEFPIGKWPLRGDKQRSKPTGSTNAGFFFPLMSEIQKSC